MKVGNVGFARGDERLFGCRFWLVGMNGRLRCIFPLKDLSNVPGRTYSKGRSGVEGA